MGAAISGHWDLGDTRTSRDYDTLVRSLGRQAGAVAQKRHILASRSCLADKMAAHSDS